MTNTRCFFRALVFIVSTLSSGVLLAGATSSIITGNFNDNEYSANCPSNSVSGEFSATIDFDCTFQNNPLITNSGQAIVEPGRLRTRAKTEKILLSDVAGIGSTRAGMIAQAEYTENLSFINAPDFGFFEITVEVDGAFDYSYQIGPESSGFPNSASAFVSLLANATSSGQNVVLFSEQLLFESPANGPFAPTSVFTNSQSIPEQTVTVQYPYFNNQLFLRLSLSAGSNCSIPFTLGNRGTNCGASANFGNSATIVGARVLDSNMQIVEEATVETESGFDYLTGFVDPNEPSLISVPSTVGLPQELAETTLLDAQLSVGNVTSQPNLIVPTGSVISQDPVAGIIVDAGSVVDLVLSSGEPLAIVPDVIGLTQVAAVSAIESAGLFIGNLTTQTDSTVAAGNILSQIPIAGTEIFSNSLVDIVVSSGMIQPIDSDGDGISDEVDFCDETTLPDDRPRRLKRNRFYTDSMGVFVRGDGSRSGFTVANTFGCSGIQIIEAAELGNGHRKFGISKSALEYWITSMTSLLSYKFLSPFDAYLLFWDKYKDRCWPTRATRFNSIV